MSSGDPAESLSIEYQIQRGDCTSASFLYNFHQRNGRIVIPIYLGLTAIMWFMLNDDQIRGFFLGFYTLLSFIMFYRFLLSPHLMARKLFQTIGKEKRLEASKAGLLFTSPTDPEKKQPLPWNLISKFLKSRRIYLFVMKSPLNMIAVVPRRAFREKEEEIFNRIVRENLLGV